MTNRDTDTISRPQWIPVTERLPEKAEPVLFWDADEECICYGYYAEPQWKELYVNNFFENVTAWMPLPEPYQGN